MDENNEKQMTENTTDTPKEFVPADTSDAQKEFVPADTSDAQKEFVPAGTSDAYGQVNDTVTRPVSAFEMPAENKTTVPAGSYNNYYTDNSSSNTANSLEDMSTGFAIASLVLGIVGIFTSCCCGFGIIPGILGIIFGCVQPKDPFNKKPGMAIAGIILSVVALLLSITFFAYFYLVGSLT
ncbi:MAG: DUF4190 domain-containing protein [Bacteroidales bacterium]|nr:DUF4190 domain-containing protein [Clostridium sp.]MCM1203371.1 DUF4190 domain-containing protein [Bacteroidales bacterium]